MPKSASGLKRILPSSRTNGRPNRDLLTFRNRQVSFPCIGEGDEDQIDLFRTGVSERLEGPHCCNAAIKSSMRTGLAM